MIASQDIKDDWAVISPRPMSVYLFVVAVGTDCNILLTKRFREEILDGASPLRPPLERSSKPGPRTQPPA